MRDSKVHIARKDDSDHPDSLKSAKTTGDREVFGKRLQPGKVKLRFDLGIDRCQLGLLRESIQGAKWMRIIRCSDEVSRTCTTIRPPLPLAS